jgi:hypothetical protein
MFKLIEIAKSWIAAAEPTPEQKHVAEQRIITCNACPYKQYQKHFGMYTCGLCGCPLDKKIFSPLPGEKACPDKRWEI